MSTLQEGGLIGEIRLIQFRANVNRKSEQTVLVVGDQVGFEEKHMVLYSILKAASLPHNERVEPSSYKCDRGSVAALIMIIISKAWKGCHQQPKSEGRMCYLGAAKSMTICQLAIPQRLRSDVMCEGESDDNGLLAVGCAHKQ